MWREWWFHVTVVQRWWWWWWWETGDCTSVSQELPFPNPASVKKSKFHPQAPTSNQNKEINKWRRNVKRGVYGSCHRVRRWEYEQHKQSIKLQTGSSLNKKHSEHRCEGLILSCCRIYSPSDITSAMLPALILTPLMLEDTQSFTIQQSRCGSRLWQINCRNEFNTHTASALDMNLLAAVTVASLQTLV